MSNTRHKPAHFIIVPEGISADIQNGSAKKPSFVYRQILDYAIQIASDGDCLYLAPANTRKGKSEHELANDYLMQTNTKRLQVFCPPVSYQAYIDTYKNAILLKQLLCESIISRPCELICAYIHSYRAEYCFRKTGFHISKVHRVHYSTTGEAIMHRWWYYKYKPIHCVYEILALIRDIVRKPASPP